MGRATFLYVIGARSGPHKVGVSSEPRRRLRELQTGSHKRLLIKRTSEYPVQDAERVETYAHWLLSESAIRGEWFKVTEEAAWVALTAAQEAIASGLDVPEPFKPEPGKRGRPKNDHEPVLIRFVPGTRERIKSVLAEGEDNASFVRLAVDKEVRRRERKSPTPNPQDTRE